MKALILMLSFLICSSSWAEDIHYQLYAVSPGGLELIASGSRTYSEEDFAIAPEDRNGKFYGVRKILDLHDGYGVGILDNFDNSTGFGLSVEHLPIGSNPNDFSWEWYDLDVGNIFSKRQGGTRIEVTFAGLPIRTELRSVEFLEDVDFDYKANICCEETPDSGTHVLRILSGSILQFPAWNGT